MFSPNHRRQPTDDVAIDPREVDKVLSEMAAMIGRWNLFKKFLSDALKVWALNTSSRSKLIPCIA